MSQATKVYMAEELSQSQRAESRTVHRVIHPNESNERATGEGRVVLERRGPPQHHPEVGKPNSQQSKQPLQLCKEEGQRELGEM